MRYIAYGSNLSLEQMAFRCPDAKIAGKGMLEGWKLKFRYHATIERSEGSRVPVLVWEISRKDEKSLDRYEGYPHYYMKRKLKVAMTDLAGKNEETVTAMVYIMTGKGEGEIPAASYYELLSEGYKRFGFDTEILVRALEEAEEESGE